MSGGANGVPAEEGLAAESPVSPAGSLHASYHEFKARERAREESEAEAARAAEAHAHRHDPVPNAADAATSEQDLLQPVRPFYSSALAENRTASAGGGAAGTAPLSARKSGVSRISVPGSGSGPNGGAPSTPKKSPVLASNSRLTRGTSSSDARRASISERKAEFARESNANAGDLHGEAFASTPRKGAAPRRSSATFPDPPPFTPATPTRPTSASAKKRPSTAGASTAASASANGAPLTPASRTVRKSLIPSFSAEKKKMVAPSPSSPPGVKSPSRATPGSGGKSSFSAIKSAARASNQAPFTTRFEVIEPPKRKPPVPVQNYPTAASPAATVSFLDVPLVRRDDVPEEAARDAPPQPSGQNSVDTALVPVASSSPPATSPLAPRPSQVVATLSTTPRGPSLVPASLQLANLPHSASKKVPLSLMSRSGDSRPDCSSCHALHMRADKLSVELARAHEHLQGMHQAKLLSDTAAKDRLKLTTDNDGLRDRLAKAEARCATMSNQLTTIRLEHEKHVRAELAAASETHARAAAEASQKQNGVLLGELETTRGKLDAAVLEKKGLVARLAQVSTAKRALEKTLSSLEASYKTLQEAHEVLLIEQRSERNAARETGAMVDAARESSLALELDVARGENERQALVHAKAVLEQDLAAAREELEALHDRTASSANYATLYERAKTALEAADARTQDLNAQLRVERDVVRQARAERDQTVAELELASREHEAALASQARELDRRVAEVREEADASRADVSAVEQAVIQARMLGDSYKLEVDALRAELAQLQHEKAETTEENMRLRTQAQTTTMRQQRQPSQPPTPLHIQADEWTDLSVPASARTPVVQVEEEESAAAEAEDEDEEHSAPRISVPQPSPRGSTRTQLASPRGSSYARHETPSPRPRQSSPAPTPHPQPQARSRPTTPLSSRVGSGVFGRATSPKTVGASSVARTASTGGASFRSKSPPPLKVGSPRASTAASRASSVAPSPRIVPDSARSIAASQRSASPPPSASALPSPTTSTFADSTNNFFAATSSSIASSNTAPSAAGSVSTASGADGERQKMLHSLDFFRTQYADDDATQQALLVLEGLMQQASILQAKLDEKQAALNASQARAASSAPDADPRAVERYRAELRVVGNTLELTKDNIRAHWQTLLASIANAPPGSASVNTAAAAAVPSSIVGGAAPSPRLASPIRNLTKPLFTTPAFASSSLNIPSALLASQGAAATTAAAPSQPNRFAAWSATYAPPGTGTVASPVRAQASSSSLFSPAGNGALRYSSLVSPAPAPAATPSAAIVPSPASNAVASSYFSHLGGTGIHRTLSFPSAVTPTVAATSAASTATAPYSSLVAPLSATPASGTGAGGSTFNLQVSKDAKNIYISHHAVPPAGPLATNGVAPAPALPSSTFTRPTLGAPTSSPTSAVPSSFVRTGLGLPSPSFASPALDRFHQHTSFNSTPGVGVGGNNGPSAFLSPAFSATPFSARAFSHTPTHGLASPGLLSAATMPTSTGGRY